MELLLTTPYNALMKFTIQIAGLYIEITSLYLQVWYLCRNYICRDAHNHSIVPNLFVSTNLSEINELRYKITGDNPLSNNEEFSNEQIEVILVHQKVTELLLSKSIILMHGSVVVTDNEAYMITAPSGTGKTYRSVLWLSHIPNSYFLNGDKQKKKKKNDRIYACGSPWCGKERFSSNKTIPLKAIFFLERSNSTDIQRIAFKDAFFSLMKQTHLPDDSYKLIKTIQILKSFDGVVDLYRFLSTQEPSAVIKAYEVASGKHIINS